MLMFEPRFPPSLVRFSKCPPCSVGLVATTASDFQSRCCTGEADFVTEPFICWDSLHVVVNDVEIHVPVH